MKYNIDGIELGETISSYGRVEKDVLEVRYQDGTSDYFPTKKETVDKVRTVMEEQATTYVNSEREKKSTCKKNGYTIGSVALGAGTIALAPHAISGLITSQPDVAYAGAAVICLGAMAVTLIKRGSAKKELDYIKKMRLFLENKDLIQEKYSPIKNAEENLGVSTGVNKININNVDKVSLADMQEAISKCKRYPVIDSTPFQKHL